MSKPTAINRLNASQINSITPGKFFDGAGLILVRGGGASKWVFRYTHGGKRREMGLGGASVTLKAARIARNKWAAVLATGLDPIEERKRVTKTERDGADMINPLFADMVLMSFEARKGNLRRGGDGSDWVAPLQRHAFPRLGGIRMADITPLDIQAALGPIWRTKHPTAEKVLQRIAITFRDAALLGAACAPITVDRARFLLGTHHHTARHVPSTPWADIPALFARLGDSAPHNALKWAILTATRSAAVRGARMAEISDGVWTIPPDRVKASQRRIHAFRVPVSTHAQDVVNALSGPDFLFSGRFERPLGKNQMNEALRSLGEAGRVHGFRSSFRTWVQDQGGEREVAEGILDHAVYGATEAVYARSDILHRRRIVLENWGAFVTGKQSDVININDRKTG